MEKITVKTYVPATKQFVDMTLTPIHMRDGLALHGKVVRDPHTGDFYTNDSGPWTITHVKSGMAVHADIDGTAYVDALFRATLKAAEENNFSWDVPFEELQRVVDGDLAGSIQRLRNDPFSYVNGLPPITKEPTTEQAQEFNMSYVASGWPEPTSDTPTNGMIVDWLMDSVCEATDGCTVESDSVCSHGYPSWLKYLGLV